MEPSHKISEHILFLADRCVKCGLCLPQCPTYTLAANENESPRGRIALIQGWLTGQLSLSSKLIQHLDRCLLCRRCERVCPSQVSYGEIIDQSKILITQQQNNVFSFKKTILNNGLKLFLNKRVLNVYIPVLRFIQKIGLSTFAKKSGLLKLIGLQRIYSYLPKLNKPIKTKNFYPAKKPNSTNENIALFTGCLSKQLDPKTVSASIKLLNQLGFGVYVPEQQVCCGALDLHDGNKQQAITLAQNNVETFNMLKVTTVVSIVNGCTSQLREYGNIKEAGNFIPETKDIIEFLYEINWPADIKLQPFEKTVALQVPCSLQNILRAEDKLINLISRIPKLTMDTIYNKCCGAAGSYFLRQPQLSDQLKEHAITELNKTSPDFIISSNIGCALQLKSGLPETENTPQVIHPVVLLEQQLSE